MHPLIFFLVNCILVYGSQSQMTPYNSQDYFKINGLPVGFVPLQDASPTPMADINQVLSQCSGGSSAIQSATYGWYAQVYPWQVFQGEQLLKVKDDIIKSGAIFEPAIMPLESYQGFTQQNNSQAIAIANVLKQFTDANVQIRLRFGHEMNYYGPNGTYENNPLAFREAFEQVSLACQSICPSVDMVFNPNNGTLSDIDQWAPDPTSYTYIALDYYPWQAEDMTLQNYIAVVQPFYSQYGGKSGEKKFIIAETSLQFQSTEQQRIQWLQTLTNPSLRKTFSNLQSLTWFNVDKECPYAILYPPNQTQQNQQFIQAFPQNQQTQQRRRCFTRWKGIY